MAMFVVVGCGTAVTNGAFDAASRLMVAFAFGMGILVLAYAFAPHSGAQINCAVTLALVLGGALPPAQGAANFVGQTLGSVVGAIVLCAMVPCSEDVTGNLGANVVNVQYGNTHALAAEIFGTFLLCLVVFETAVSEKAIAGNVAPLAIGFAVFLAHVILLPIDGCSINPTRSFGPAIVSNFRDCQSFSPGGLRDFWVMVAGPCAGAALAAAVKSYFSSTSGESSGDDDDDDYEQGAKELVEAAPVTKDKADDDDDEEAGV